MADIDDIWAQLQADTAPKKARKPAPRVAVSDAARASRASKEQHSPAPPELPAARQPPLSCDGSDETLETWARPLRRDLNRVLDADRADRLRALKALLEAVSGSGAPSGELAHRAWNEVLLRPLLRGISDENEKCREAAASALLAAARIGGDSGPALGLAVPVVSGRLQYDCSRLGGSAVPVEVSEEVRLALAELVHAVVLQCSEPAQLTPHLSELMALLGRVGHDPFHEVRKAATLTMAALAQSHPLDTQLHAPGLLRALLPSLGHQHAKMRMMALEALTAFSCCGPQPLVLHDASEILKVIQPLCKDRASAVRQQLVHSLELWLHLRQSKRGGGEHVASALLKAVLVLVGDEHAGVAAGAYQLVCSLGAGFLSSQPSEQQPSEPSSELQAVAATAEHEIKAARCLKPVPRAPSLQCSDPPAPRSPHSLPSYPAPFGARPPDGATALVQAHMPVVLPLVLDELAEWTETGRSSAVQLLHTCLVLCEDQLLSMAPSLLQALCRARSASSSRAMASAVDACAAVCGCYLHPDVSLPVCLPVLPSEPGGLQVCTQLLLAAHHPTSPSVLRELLAAMVAVIEATELPPAQIAALLSLSEAIAGTQAAEPAPLLLLFAHLAVLAELCPAEEHQELQAGCEAAQHSLAGAAGVSALYCQHAGHVFSRLTRGGCEHWTGSALGWRVCLLVLQRGGPSVLAAHPVARDTLMSCLHVSREPSLRITALQLLHAMLAAGPVPWQPQFVGQLLHSGVLPNAVWRAGKGAAQARHHALQALHQLGERGQEEHKPFWETAVREPSHGLLALLLSALEDDDGASRLLAAQVLRRVLGWLPGSTLVYDQVRTMIPEVLKRLDDSRDAVRLEALAVLHNMAAVIESLQVGTYVEYITAGLLIYLEDASLQAPLMQTLARFGHADPEIFAKEVQKSRDKGVAPLLCDQLLEAAREHVE